MERNIAVEVCDYDGRHVCWAKSLEHAMFIVNAVNYLHRTRTERVLDEVSFAAAAAFEV